jgi:exosortase
MSDQAATVGILGEFQTDLVEAWRRLPNKGFFIALFAAWLALFQFLGNSTFGYVDSPSLLRWMYSVYRARTGATDDGHGLLIPFVVLGLFWWKRKELLALRLETWWPALSLVALGLFLHVIGYVIQQPRVSIVALFTGLYGLMGLAWGRAWLRASFFPFFLFAFCVPFGSLAEPITFPLRILVCQLVEVVAHYILAIDVVRVGTQLMDPTGHYQYDVAPACSGIRSLVAIFVLAIIYGFVNFRAWWKRCLLVASAFPLAVLGNLARLLVIVIAAELGGAAKGQDWGNSVHESWFFSLLPYVPAMLGLVYLGHLLEDRRPPDSKPNP